MNFCELLLSFWWNRYGLEFPNVVLGKKKYEIIKLLLWNWYSVKIKN